MAAFHSSNVAKSNIKMDKYALLFSILQVNIGYIMRLWLPGFLILQQTLGKLLFGRKAVEKEHVTMQDFL